MSLPPPVAPPRIFASLRRLAARRRILALQARADAARMPIAAGHGVGAPAGLWLVLRGPGGEIG